MHDPSPSLDAQPSSVAPNQALTRTFGLMSALGCAMAFGLGLWVHASVPIALVSPLMVGIGHAIAFVAFRRIGYPHSRLGLCNTVTSARLAMTGVLVGCVILGGGAPWPVFLIAAVAFAMDGLDGWLARREGLTSAFGARFDMEVDSVLALSLACLAFQTGAAGVYVLLLGLPRYLFGAAAWVWPWLNGDLPPRFSRKVACVVQILALVLMVFPPLGPPVTDAFAGLAALGLIWSFWVDIRWLKGVHR